MGFVNRAIDVDGRRVTLADHGTGAPLVLLHGGIIDQADYSWRRVAERMAETRRVILPNLPGYGDSDGFDRPHDIGDLGRWLIAFLDAMGLDRVDLAGLSMGGGIALWCALHHPERIARLVLVDPYGLSARVAMHPVVSRVVGGVAADLVYRGAARSPLLARLGLQIAYGKWRLSPGDTEDMMRAARVQVRRRTFDGFCAQEISHAGLRTDFSDRVGQIAVPTLLIHGRRDPLIPLADVRRAVARMPEGRLVVLPGGHIPMRQDLDGFMASFTDFLD